MTPEPTTPASKVLFVPYDPAKHLFGRSYWCKHRLEDQGIFPAELASDRTMYCTRIGVDPSIRPDAYDLLFGPRIPSPEALAEATRKGEAKTDDDIIRDSNPSRCPFTNRPFFMVIEHPERGPVATYGGPYDSYTLPEPDDMDRPDCDHVLRCERFDHDAGHWVEGGDPLGLEVVTNRELSDLYEFKYRVEEVAGKARAMDEILNAACAGKGVEVNLRTGRVAIPPVRVSRELANWLLDVLLDRKPAAILDAGAGKGEGKQ